jgi:hypothetical protein
MSDDYDGHTRSDVRGRGIDGMVRCSIFGILRQSGFERVYSYVRETTRRESAPRNAGSGVSAGRGTYGFAASARSSSQEEKRDAGDEAAQARQPVSEPVGDSSVPGGVELSLHEAHSIPVVEPAGTFNEDPHVRVVDRIAQTQADLTCLLREAKL